MQADKEECTTTSLAVQVNIGHWTHFWALRIQERRERPPLFSIFLCPAKAGFPVCTSAGPQKLALFFVMYTSKRSWTCLTNHARFDSNWILIASCKTRVCCWQSLSSSKDSIFSSNFTGSYLLFFKGLARGIILKSSGKSSKVWLKACF